MTLYGLSLKQPWAALVVHGRKTVEVRRWPTTRRGLVLIHAARVPDDRPAAWKHVPPELLPAARQTGGLVGAAVLTDCRPYRNLEVFVADQARHLNEPGWFQEGLHGFVFDKAARLPFRPWTAQVRFFRVEGVSLDGLPSELGGRAATGSRLLVSVRSAAEARAARAGGCDLLDAKEPAAGPLGAVSPAVLAEILAAADGVPVSAALGELPDGPLPDVADDVAYVKVGLAGWAENDWRGRLAVVRSPRLVAAAYADHMRARSPTPEAVLAAAIDLRLAAFLVDTWDKEGGGLLGALGRGRLAALVARAKSAGMPVALAGALTAETIAALRDLAPDWFAVRGAACDGGRAGTVSTRRVAELAALTRGPLHFAPGLPGVAL